MSEAIPLVYYLILAAVVFFSGLYGMLSSRNTITMLISAQLMLCAVNISLGAFNSHLSRHSQEGVLMIFFISGVIAAQTAVAAVLITKLCRKYRSASLYESVTPGKKD
ncbi:MAG: NADH-quinone oxidoreductase subunit NuoK [Bacteroidales bacterium]|jgi:NADH:ubiquinone oxidoreductase subunit K|nr:NADH-quinone oxidoreductase subunit NuoK [Bacteroidales bacterium]